MRFFELANQIGVEKKNFNVFLDFAKASGFDIKNSLAVVDDKVIDWAQQNTAAILKRVSEPTADAAAPKKRPLSGVVAKKKAPKAAAKTADKNEKADRPAEEKAPAPAVAPAPAAPAPTVAAAPKVAPAKPAPQKNKPPVPLPPKKKEAHRVTFPMPEPRRVDVGAQGGLVIEDSQNNSNSNAVNTVSQKHKRADFKVLTRPELPAIFASGENEYTRSIRSSGPAKRQQQQRPPMGPGGGKGKHFKGNKNRQMPAQAERDPNAKAELEPTMSLRNLSEALGVKLNAIMGFLMKNGQLCAVNDILDQDTIVLIAEEFKVPYEWKAEETLEEQLEKALERAEERSAQAKHFSRAPIITFMGHVDHGKTSLLDKIRSTRIAEKEYGGITQHIGAYTVNKDGKKITFLDTPGHEAFTQMRARGANLTDVVVLVVAADDGVMPQTKEACAHAKNANVPIVVAINKCDIAGANPDRVKQELSTQLELLPEEWGGKIGVVEVSAHTGQGIDELLERILLEAEMLELDADPSRKAVGYVIESKMSDNRGVVATVLIKDGTLHRGDVLLTGNGYGKVRLMYGWDGETCESGGPSDAVSIIGLNNVPEVGEKVYAVSDMVKARKLAEERETKNREQALASQRRRHVSLENLMEHLEEKENVKELNVIIKADVTGSLEVLQKTISDMATPEIHINIIHAAVGGISQADVILADASDALIVGFHVIADNAAKLQATSLDVQIKTYHIIYRLIEDMKAALVGMLPKEEKETVRGHIEIRQVFHTSKFGNIAGCAVVSGTVNRKCRVRLIRDNVVIYDGALDSLKRGKDDAKEVREGYECGIRIANYDDIREGDKMEAYEIESVARTLD